MDGVQDTMTDAVVTDLVNTPEKDIMIRMTVDIVTIIMLCMPEVNFVFICFVD